MIHIHSPPPVSPPSLSSAPFAILVSCSLMVPMVTIRLYCLITRIFFYRFLVCVNAQTKPAFCACS